MAKKTKCCTRKCHSAATDVHHQNQIEQRGTARPRTTCLPAFLLTFLHDSRSNLTAQLVAISARMLSFQIAASALVLWWCDCLLASWLTGWLSWAERAHWNRKRCCRYAEWMAWWHISGQKDNIFIWVVYFCGRSLCRCVGVLFRWPRNPVKFCPLSVTNNAYVNCQPTKINGKPTNQPIPSHHEKLIFFVGGGCTCGCTRYQC